MFKPGHTSVLLPLHGCPPAKPSPRLSMSCFSTSSCKKQHGRAQGAAVGSQPGGDTVSPFQDKNSKPAPATGAYGLDGFYAPAQALSTPACGLDVSHQQHITGLLTESMQPPIIHPIKPSLTLQSPSASGEHGVSLESHKCPEICQAPVTPTGFSCLDCDHSISFDQSEKFRTPESLLHIIGNFVPLLILSV